MPPEPPPPVPEPPAPPPSSPPAPPTAGSGPSISLNSVSFEQLRTQGLSVTQATRLLAHRERIGSFQSLDDLDEVPGFPKDQLEDLKRRSEL
jgi:DNA uptake protein ComE-like DNA-binding protein